MLEYSCDVLMVGDDVCPFELFKKSSAPQGIFSPAATLGFFL
tara:strand:+ start:101 stop:226 length:126 start_codon:yes stop_codon:yes gene_type:complete